MVTVAILGLQTRTWYACKQDISKTKNARDMEQKAN